MNKFVKKYIKNYLKKHLGSYKKNFWLLRFLSDLVMDMEIVDHVCENISVWMYHNNVNYPVNDVIVIDNLVYIYTHKPGLWIGKGGSNVHSLEKYLYANDIKTAYKWKIRFIEIRETPFVKIQNWLYYLHNNF